MVMADADSPTPLRPDEIMVDLMKSGCGVNYADANRDAVYREIEGVRIPFASPQTLWRMKQTVREKDIPDRLFLRANCSRSMPRSSARWSRS